jgi:hypothetical protein
MSSGVIVMYFHGLMYRHDDVKDVHCCLFMVDRNNQMDKLQSGPLMVKSLTRRCSGINFSKWSHYGVIPHGKMLCEVQMFRYPNNVIRELFLDKSVSVDTNRSP